MVYIPEGLSTLTPTLSNGGPSHHILQGTDATTVVRGAGYISDATARGIKVGDLVFYTQWTTFTDQYNFTAPILASHIFLVLSITAGAADLSDGLAIPVTNT